MDISLLFIATSPFLHISCPGDSSYFHSAALRFPPFLQIHDTQVLVPVILGPLILTQRHSVKSSDQALNTPIHQHFRRSTRRLKSSLPMGLFNFFIEVCDSAIEVYEDVVDASLGLFRPANSKKTDYTHGRSSVKGTGKERNPERSNSRGSAPSSNHYMNMETVVHRVSSQGRQDNVSRHESRQPRQRSPNPPPSYHRSRSQRSTSTSSSIMNPNLQRRSTIPAYAHKSQPYDTWQDARPEKRTRSSSAPRDIVNLQPRYLYDKRYEYERRSSVGSESTSSRRNSLDGSPNPYLFPPPIHYVPSGIRGGYLRPMSRASSQPSSELSPKSNGYLSPDPRQSSFSTSTGSPYSRSSSSSAPISGDNPSLKQYVSTSRRRNSIPAYYQKLRNQEDDFDAWESARLARRTRSTSMPWVSGRLEDGKVTKGPAQYGEREESMPGRSRQGASTGYAEDEIRASRAAKIPGYYLPRRAAPPLPPCRVVHVNPAAESASNSATLSPTDAQSPSPISLPSVATSSSSAECLQPKPLHIHSSTITSPPSPRYPKHTTGTVRPSLKSLPLITSKLKPASEKKTPSPLTCATASTPSRTRTRPFSPTVRTPINVSLSEKIPGAPLSSPHVRFVSPVVTRFIMLSPRNYSPSPLPLSPCTLKAYKEKGMGLRSRTSWNRDGSHSPQWPGSW